MELYSCSSHTEQYGMQSRVEQSVARTPKTFHEAGTAIVFCRGTGVMLIFRPPLLRGVVGTAVLDFHIVYFSAPDGSLVRPSYRKYGSGLYLSHLRFSFSSGFRLIPCV
jgi:hypothetical protein